MKIYELVHEREPETLGIYFDLEKAKRAAIEHFNPSAPPGLVPVFTHPDKNMKAYDPDDWIWMSYLIIESETTDEPVRPVEVFNVYQWEGTDLLGDWTCSSLDVAMNHVVDLEGAAARDEIYLSSEYENTWIYWREGSAGHRVHIVKEAVLDA